MSASPAIVLLSGQSVQGKQDLNIVCRVHVFQLPVLPHAFNKGAIASPESKRTCPMFYAMSICMERLVCCWSAFSVKLGGLASFVLLWLSVILL